MESAPLQVWSAVLHLTTLNHLNQTKVRLTFLINATIMIRAEFRVTACMVGPAQAAQIHKEIPVLKSTPPSAPHGAVP